MTINDEIQIIIRHEDGKSYIETAQFPNTKQKEGKEVIFNISSHDIITQAGGGQINLPHKGLIHDNVETLTAQIKVPRPLDSEVRLEYWYEDILLVAPLELIDPKQVGPEVPIKVSIKFSKKKGDSNTEEES